MKSNSNIKYPLFVSGLAVIGGVSYYLYRNYVSEEKSDYEVSKEIVENIMKDLRKYFVPILKEMSFQNKQMQ